MVTTMTMTMTMSTTATTTSTPITIIITITATTIGRRRGSPKATAPSSAFSTTAAGSPGFRYRG